MSIYSYTVRNRTQQYLPRTLLRKELFITIVCPRLHTVHIVHIVLVKLRPSSAPLSTPHKTEPAGNVCEMTEEKGFAALGMELTGVELPRGALLKAYEAILSVQSIWSFEPFLVKQAAISPKL